MRKPIVFYTKLSLCAAALLCWSLSAALAQVHDNASFSHSIENYVPPPMFEDMDNTTRPPYNKARRGALIVTGDKDILPPQKIRKTNTNNVRPVQHIKPPIPPRRPEKFSISPRMLEGIRNGSLVQSTPSAAEAYAGSRREDEALEIVPMDINDIYRNLSESGL